MKLRNKTLIGGMCALLGTAACGSDSATNPNTPDTKTGTVVGRLELGGQGSASSASAYRLGDDGSLTLAGEGAVAADGSFTIEGVDGDGPFIVQLGDSGSIVGQVIVPQDVGDGDQVETMPVDGETTAEAEALIDIVKGDADTDDVDTIGLMSYVDGELAASATTDEIGDGYMSAQEGWLRVTGQGAAQLEQAKLQAYGELAAKLNAASTSSDDAWDEFHNQVVDSLETSLQVSSTEQSDAQAAASVLFASSFEGTSSDDTASRIAAVLSAQADFAAQREAIDGSPSEAAVSAKLDAAYEAFFSSMDQADSAEAMQAAQLALSGAISGYGSDEGESALDILIAGEGQSAESGDIASAFESMNEAHASLSAKIEAALAQQSGQAQGVADAYGEFRASVDAAFAGFAGEGQQRMAAFAASAAAQLAGHGGSILDLDLSDILDDGGDPTTDLGLDISGSIAVEISDAVDAILVSFDASGTVHQISDGTVEGGSYHFSDVTSLSGTLVVQLKDQSGQLAGAVALDSISQSEGQYDAESVTNETTVEAEVLMSRLGDGEQDVDFDSIAARIDGAIAAAATDGDDDQADLDAVTAATIASEHSQAAAALTFATVVETMRGDDAPVSDASEARSRIEAALALDGSLQQAFEGSTFESRSAEVHAAVQALVQGEGSDQASSAFVDAMLAIEDRMNDDMNSNLVSRTAIEAAFVSSFTAGDTFRSALAAAFTASSQGSFDGGGFDSASGSARSAFDASIAAAFELSTVGMSEADHDAVTSFAAQLSLAFSGSFDGTFAD